MKTTKNEVEVNTNKIYSSKLEICNKHETSRMTMNRQITSQGHKPVCEYA